MRPPNTRLTLLFKRLNFCLEFPWPCLLAWPQEHWTQGRQLVRHQTSSGPTEKFPFLIHSSHPQTKRTPPGSGGGDPSCLSDLPPRSGGGAPFGLGFHKVDLRFLSSACSASTLSLWQDHHVVGAPCSSLASTPKMTVTSGHPQSLLRAPAMGMKTSSMLVGGVFDLADVSVNKLFIQLCFLFLNSIF